MFDEVRRPIAIVALAGAGALLLAACGGGASVEPKAAAAPQSCPRTWRAGWQRLANQIDAPVYCPSWMPAPLDGQMGGEYANGRFVSADRSYLVSFVSIEHDTGGISAEVHVNFRGYPGSTRIP